MAELPWTPDFDVWPIDHGIAAAETMGQRVRVAWDDGRACEYHAFLLRENSPDAATVHPKSREMLCSPLDIPDDLQASKVSVDESGCLVVTWSPDGRVSRYHPGWLRAHGWFEDPAEGTQAVLWSASEQSEPPTFDGPQVLDDPTRMLAWLEALRGHGIARLHGLPQDDGLLERLVTAIGPIRETNFGRLYRLEIKDDPDSNAFTSDALPLHMDLPTRETPHGLQFLYCRANTASGGEGIYADAYRIAEDMRHEEPAHFASLTGDAWEYNNRARTSDYRARGPVVETDPDGRVAGIRYNTFLRAPLKAPVAIQARAYRAYRAFCRRAQDPRYRMVLRYRPGDLVAFDNRRVLHGRVGFDGTSGVRFLEGAYADRDDLQSRIRILKRRLRQAAAP